MLFCVELHSKGPEVRPVSPISMHAVNKFLSDVFARWGHPNELINDNGRQFVAREFALFLCELQIKDCKTALYHPQSNGAVERVTRVRKEGLRAARAGNRPCDKAIGSILAKFRSRLHSRTGKTPVQLMFGRRMRIPVDLLRHVPSERHVTLKV